jgi:secreted PhoX family phosphatase
MPITRRNLIRSGAAAAAVGSLAKVIGSATPAYARGGRPAFKGYGPLVPDPAGILNLPRGFSYRAFSREGDTLTGGGIVPAAHDGMAAFEAGPWGTFLVRNHEVGVDDVVEDGRAPVPHIPGATYDPEGTGGTTTLFVGPGNRLITHRASLAGTITNCAGGPTPWDTWLTCEEDDSILSKPHGYVFEVDPWHGGNPEPIRAMGRFEHEAAGFDRRGNVYLTEDADEPHGCIYRFRPNRPLRGRGSLHAGGALTAMKVAGVTADLSGVLTPGTILPVSWVNVPNPDPGDGATPVREQVIAAGATPVMKAEGVWRGLDGDIWFVSSRGGGPAPEDAEDASAGAHAGQIWRYDPDKQLIELVVVLPVGSPFDGPDNITAGPHGFLVACTDGEDDQYLVGVNEDGETFAFAKNAQDDGEFAGATFSPDGDTLFCNVQGEPSVTFAITGPWRRHGRDRD